MVPEWKPKQYVEIVWHVKNQSSDWKRIDMAWFSSVRLVSTHHHTKRAVGDGRDPALACRRIQTQAGHHARFGHPFVCSLSDGKIAVAAHDVAFVAVQRGSRTLVVITTLSKHVPIRFDSFMKKRAGARRRRGAPRKENRTHRKIARRL